MDMLEFHLMCFRAKKYERCIEKLKIWTSWYRNNCHPNVRCKLVVNNKIKHKNRRIHSQCIEDYIYGNKIQNIKKRDYANRRVKIIQDIEREMLIQGDTFYKSFLTIKFITDIIRNYTPSIKIDINFCGEETNHLSRSDYWLSEGRKIDEKNIVSKLGLVEKYEEKLKKEIDKRVYYYKNEKYNKSCLYTILKDIERKLSKQRDAYIISSLTRGELTRDEVRKYPDLIKTADILKKIKIAVE
jgi:hypothetical protein